MKFVSIIFLFIFSISLALQLNPLEKRITFEIENEKIEKVIAILNQKLGHIFTYKSNIFPKDKKVSLKVKDTPLKSVLDKIFKDTKIIYSFFGGQIILKVKTSYQKINSIEESRDTVSEKEADFSFIEPLEVIKIASSSNDMQNETKSKFGNVQTLQNEFRLNKYMNLIDINNDLKKRDLDSSAEHFQSTLIPYNSDIDSSYFHLQGNHQIYLSSGMKLNSQISSDLVGVQANSEIFGSINYGYCIDDSWTIGAQFGAHWTQSSASIIATSSSAVMSFLFGIKYYIPLSAIKENLLVFGGINLGVYINTVSSISGLASISNRVETAFGAQPIIGIDFFPFSWIKLGTCIKYNTIGGSSSISGNTKNNINGLEFSFDFGVLL